MPDVSAQGHAAAGSPKLAAHTQVSANERQIVNSSVLGHCVLGNLLREESSFSVSEPLED